MSDAAAPAPGPGGEQAGRPSPRVVLAFAAGALAAVGTGVFVDWDYAAAVGWDVTGVLFLASVWRAIAGMDAEATAAHATQEDPTKRATTVIVLTACVASLVAVGYLLVQASAAHGLVQGLTAGLAVVSVAVSWWVVHTLFMLRYASLYYGPADGGPTHGVVFDEHGPPRYSDFAYLAFTVGMTFQVSDTSLSDHRVRVTVLRHALLSYLFGALILAATVNLVASLAGSST